MNTKTLPEYQSHNICDVLTKLMKDSNLDDQDLSRHTFVPAPTIARLRSNAKSNPTLSSLEPLAEFFGITIDQLIGKDELPKNRATSTYYSSGFTASRIPVVDWCNIQKYLEKQSSDTKTIKSWVSSEKSLAEGSFGLIINSISFGILFRKGSLVIVEPTKEIFEGDFILMVPEKQKKPALRMVIIDNDEFYSKSCNPEIKDFTLLSEKSSIIGKVVETRHSYEAEVGTKQQEVTRKQQDLVGVVQNAYS